MKRTQTTYLLTIGALFLLALGAGGGWFLASWAASGVWWPLVLVGALIVVSGWLLHRFVHAYFFQLRELTEDAQTMLRVNPEHRAQATGTPDVRALAVTLNEFAAERSRVQADLSAQIADARTELTEERNLLAALMAELVSGVLVCNLDGQILLYNRSARTLLGQERGARAAGGFVGLGRSVFGLVDRNSITHGLHQLRDGLAATDATAGPPICTFVTTGANGTLLRARMAPFMDRDNALGGFILALQDMTQGIESSSRRDFLLQTYTEKVRGALGNIRAAIETMGAFPDMTDERKERFQQVIEDEAQRLSALLDRTMRDHARDLKAQWRLEEMAGADLLRALRNNLERELPVAVHLHDLGQSVWLMIDSYTLVHGVTATVRQLHAGHDVDALHLHIVDDPGAPADFAAVDLRWDAGGHTHAEWQAFAQQAFIVDEGDATLTLREVADRHGGEVWLQFAAGAEAGEQVYFRMLLPVATAPNAAPAPVAAPDLVPATLESRPEYYDFDLFHQLGQRPELDAQPLRSLTYTVFDTETTGLDPRHDTIISIGAVRIVNGRVLRQEVFDQLIDPERPIPRIATEVHGIDDAMVADEPAIDQVLPRFARFAEATVLVAHNAAFDMRMLQQQEATTGARFINPVLDTLLLSAVVHSSRHDHSLEEIARRLGINILGRHTALGDALVTAEVFLRLIPLLEEQGITTLAQARDAAQQTYFARLNY